MGAIAEWITTALGQRRGTSAPRAVDGAGPVVLVCGASGAIGAAVCAVFAAQGGRLVLHYHRNERAAQRLAQELAETHAGLARPHVQGADLCDAAATRALVDQAWAWQGAIDVLVNCVGGAADAPLPMVSAQDVAQCMRHNLLPVINACEAWRVHAQARAAGRIVNVSSITGLVGQPMRAAYGAAKGAVISYTKSLARELAPHGITANCVAPQVIEGGLADLMKLRVREILLANTPVGRACTPQDVAHAVAYLAAPQASFVTGTVLPVTGGLVTW